MDKRLLSPDRAILDVILRWEDGVKLVSADPMRFLLTGRNHWGQVFQNFIECHLDGEPEDGPPPRFVLFKLGPTVWKVSPSLYTPNSVHGYLTFVGVPDPAPWESRADTD